jgi:hypothetical protein
MQRSILYSDVVTAAGKVAAIMVRGLGQTYAISTNGGTTAAVRHAGSQHYEIALPSIKASVRMSRTEADFILGLLIHELGHVRYTSFDFPKDNSRELHDLANALEDCREEKAVMTSGDPPNGAKLLAEVTETMALQASGNGGKEAWPRYTPGQAVACAIVTLGRLANPQYGPLPATTTYAASIPPRVAALVERHMAEITSTTSTAECFDLARRILASADKVLPPAEEPEKPRGGDKTTEGGNGEAEDGEGTGEAPSGDDKGTDDGQPGPGAGEGTGDGEAEDGGEGAPTGPKGNGDGEEGGDAAPTDDAGSAKGGQSHGTQDEAKPETFNPADVLAEMLKPRLAAETDYNAGRFAATVAALDAAPHESDVRQARGAVPRPKTAKDYRAAVNTAGLSPKVRAMLHSQDDSMTTRYETRGRLDRRAIARTSTGDPRVFTRRSLTDGIRTGVGFLLDMSSSMSACRKDRAQAQSAIALGDACERAGADVAIWGFGPSPAGWTRDGQTDPNKRMFGGVLLPFKMWTETMDTGAAIIAGADSPHGTNLCPAIIAACRELAARSGLDKRILMVLTDGDCRMGRPATRATAEFAAARYGVIVIGVGIMTNVEDAFAKGKSVTVHNVATLATETMRALIKAVG